MERTVKGRRRILSEKAGPPIRIPQYKSAPVQTCAPVRTREYEGVVPHPDGFGCGCLHQLIPRVALSGVPETGTATYAYGRNTESGSISCKSKSRAGIAA